MRDSRTHQELADKEFSTATLWERRRRAVAVLTDHPISIKLRNDQYAPRRCRESACVR
jgi:hypothetical protein